MSVLCREGNDMATSGLQNAEPQWKAEFDRDRLKSEGVIWSGGCHRRTGKIRDKNQVIYSIIT